MFARSEVKEKYGLQVRLPRLSPLARTGLRHCSPRDHQIKSSGTLNCA